MKTTAMWTAVVAIAALASGAAAKSEEGFCQDDKTCAKLAPGYTCVSVQTTRENTEEVKQCLPYKAPGDVCAGVSPGLCPSFSTWSKEFKSISSVCAYIVPTSKCAQGEAGDSVKGTVTCMNVTSPISDTPYSVIYGCVDYDGKKLLHEANSKSSKMAAAFNYTSIISEGCVNPKNEAGSDVVCSGRGTCSPNAAGQMDYKCLCNVGYSGTFCQKIDSNKCTMTAQCAAGKCDLIAQECKCEPGTTGNQCAECDPKSTSACNQHGTCGPASSPGTVSAAGRRWLLAEAGSGSTMGNNNTVGSTNSNSGNSSSSSANMCKCDTGYSGAHCDRKDSSGLQSSNKPTSNPTGTTVSTEAPKTGAAGSLSAITVLTVAVTLVVALLN